MTLEQIQSIISGVFIDNKYTKWYINIIINSYDKQHIGYTEKHHIIPKSIGGINNKTNIVKITAKEHYICHLLLTKMTNNIIHYNKMLLAARLMGLYNNKLSGRKKIASVVYEKTRTQAAYVHSNMMKGRIPWNKGKKMLFATRPGRTAPAWNKGTARTTKQKQYQSNLMKDRIPWNKGKKHSEETKLKMSNARKRYYILKRNTTSNTSFADTNASIL